VADSGNGRWMVTRGEGGKVGDECLGREMDG
jgi:hypothetical protein